MSPGTVPSTKTRLSPNVCRDLGELKRLMQSTRSTGVAYLGLDHSAPTRYKDPVLLVTYNFHSITDASEGSKPSEPIHVRVGKETKFPLLCIATGGSLLTVQRVIVVA